MELPFAAEDLLASSPSPSDSAFASAPAPESSSAAESSAVSEGMSLMDAGRQYSRMSAAVFNRLDSLDHRFEDLQSRVVAINEEVANADTGALLRAKSELAQICGQLEKFQFNQVDAVTTEDLVSGKDTAKLHRKELNRAIDDLQKNAQHIQAIISQKLDDIIHDLENTENKPNASTGNSSNINAGDGVILDKTSQKPGGVDATYDAAATQDATSAKEIQSATGNVAEGQILAETEETATIEVEEVDRDTLTAVLISIHACYSAGTITYEQRGLLKDLVLSRNPRLSGFVATSDPALDAQSLLQFLE